MYKEYFSDENGKVNYKKLRAERIPEKEYISMHKELPIICHDIFIFYRGDILLVKRKKAPGKGLLWPIGGRLERGRTAEESLKIKVKEECGLKIRKIKFIGIGRHFFGTEPFGHQKGTDTPTLVFIGKGYGKLKLNELHENPLLLKEKESKEIKRRLHPYVKEFLEKAFKEK